MSKKFLHPSASGGGIPAQQGPVGPAAEFIAQPAGRTGPACCCPARPAVRVLMPPIPSRPHSTELLLCGHHYLVSRDALAAARAIVRELPDTPEDIAAWVAVEPASAAGVPG